MKASASLMTVAFLLLLAPARAADPLPEKDVTAARAAVEGVIADAIKKDWTGYAKRMDPADLKTFRDNWVPTLTAAAKNGREKELLDLFDGAGDVKTVLGWSPDEFFARFMKGASKAVPSAAQGKTTVVGAVAESPELVHVVVRINQKVGAGEHAVMDVMSVRKVHGGWKAKLPKELVVVSAVIRAQGTTQDETTTGTVPPEKK